MRRVVLIIFLFILIHPSAEAQLWKLRRYELYAGFGTSQFFGDIGGFTPGENSLGFKDIIINQTRFNLQGGMRYRLFEDVALKFTIGYGFIHASDALGSNVNRDFEASTSLFEPSFTGEYYILKNSAESSYRFTKGREFFTTFFEKLDLFIYAGVAPVFYTVKPNENLEPVIEKSGGITAAFPIGVGVNYLISPNSLVGIDLGIRYTTTDYLDGYTSQYSKSNDVYYFMAFVFTQKLKTSEKGLPSFRK